MDKMIWEKRCVELAEQMDNLQDIEKKFVLWLMLGRYLDALDRERNRKDNERYTNPHVAKPWEVAELFYKAEVMRLLPMVRDDIANDLW